MDEGVRGAEGHALGGEDPPLEIGILRRGALQLIRTPKPPSIWRHSQASLTYRPFLGGNAFSVLHKSAPLITSGIVRLYCDALPPLRE